MSTTKKSPPQLSDILPEQIIDKSSPVPLHYQLEQFLRQSIGNGRFPPHATLPTEQDLQDHFELSRTPIRQAISRLVADGLVTRRRSLGTVVLPQRFEEDLRSLSSFTNEVIRKNQVPSAKLIEFSTQLADKEELKLLQLAPQEHVYHIRRIRLIDDDPIGLITSHVPVERVPNLQADDFSEQGERQSIYHVLEHIHHIQLVRAIEVFDAVNLDEESARLLQLEPLSAILVRNRISFDAQERAIAFERGLYRVRYRLSWNGSAISEIDTSTTSPMP